MRIVGLLFAALCLLASGCEKLMQNMYDQPRYKPFAASTLFVDGASARTPPDGTEPFSEGPFAGPSSGRYGSEQVAQDAVAREATAVPFPVTRQLLQRGRERFEIYCAPCHSPLGDGDGLVARRGFPHPPSYHDERLRRAPDRHFYEVMSEGYGVMASYADRVAPRDRWAIVAYIRALQLSQHAPVAALPPEVRERLEQAAAEEGRQ